MKNNLLNSIFNFKPTEEEGLKMWEEFGFLEGLDDDIKKEFAATSVYTKEKCRDCWAKFYCSGGCPANAHNFNQDINKPYEMACDLERKRVECSLWLAAKQMEAEG